MIRTKMLSRWAWLVGPFILTGMAPGQEAKPAPKETSVKVTEGRVTVVEDGEQKPNGKQKAGTAYRPVAPTRPNVASRYYAMPRQLRWTSQSQSGADPLQVKLGLEIAEADDVLRAQLQLPNRQGVVVVSVKPDGPAGESGLRVNDVIIALGEDAPDEIRGLNQVRTKLLSIGKSPIEVKLIRAGKPTRIALAGPEHGAGFVPEAKEFWIGVPVTQVDATLRIHLADLPADAGLIANDVVKDSPASKAGVKKNDILVKLGDKPLKDSPSLIAQIQAAGDKPTPLEIFRAGKPITLTITPAERSRGVAFDVNVPREVGASFNMVFPKQGVAMSDPKQQEIIVKHLEEVLRNMSGKPGLKPEEIHLEMLTSKAKAGAEDATAKIEASMKELKASIDELKRAIEGLKKPEAK